MSKKKFDLSMYMNDMTYYDYLDRFKKIATSMFEWVNLPDSMDSRYLEESLYMHGEAALLKDDTFGFINTKSCTSGDLNIYGIPTELNCYSFKYNTIRKVYTGLNLGDNQMCVLVRNNFQKLPTEPTLQLFAQRLTEAERTIDVNIKAQKTPVLITVDESQRLAMENLYNQYDGNKPVIFGDKNQLQSGILKSINTNAPYVADKVMEYKKQIWNEALTYLGISNIAMEKKERLVTDEANTNNELINLNLQSYLIPRKEACKKFNDLFGLTGTDKEIDVRVRSDLWNIIKENDSVIQDYNHNGIDDSLEGDNNVSVQ